LPGARPGAADALVGHFGRGRRRRSVAARRRPNVPHLVSSPGFAPFRRRVRSAATVGRVGRCRSVEAGLVCSLITRRRAHDAPLNRGHRPFLSASMQGSAGLRRRFALCAGDPRSSRRAGRVCLQTRHHSLQSRIRAENKKILVPFVRPFIRLVRYAALDRWCSGTRAALPGSQALSTRQHARQPH
jgi:hypothetical protein